MVSVSEVARMELFDWLKPILPGKTVDGRPPGKKTVECVVKQSSQTNSSIGLLHWIAALDYSIGLPHWITASDYRIGIPHRITALDYSTGLPLRITAPDYRIAGSHHSRWRLNKCIQWISL